MCVFFYILGALLLLALIHSETCQMNPKIQRLLYAGLLGRKQSLIQLRREVFPTQRPYISPCRLRLQSDHRIGDLVSVLFQWIVCS